MADCKRCFQKIPRYQVSSVYCSLKCELEDVDTEKEVEPVPEREQIIKKSTLN